MPVKILYLGTLYNELQEFHLPLEMCRRFLNSRLIWEDNESYYGIKFCMFVDHEWFTWTYPRGLCYVLTLSALGSAEFQWDDKQLVWVCMNIRMTGNL